MAEPNTQSQAKFLSGNLTGHIVSMTSTASIGLVALFAVDLIDMLFISMLGIEELAAAIGYAGSILFITTSVSIGMGIAGGAMVAKALGEGDKARASAVLTHALVLGALFALLIAAVIFASLDWLTGLVGASGVTQDLAVSYLQILIPTMPILMLGIIGSAALRSHGAARLAMMVTLAGGAVNAVMDPIFIFALGLGLDGAAVASVLARIAMAGTALWFLISRYGGFSATSLRETWEDLLPVSRIAFPAMLANVATPVGSAYVTRVASSFGEDAVAGMAIVGRLTPIAFAMIFAMSGAIGPIIGQNFGAKQFSRVRTAYNRAILLIVLYVVPVVLVLFLLRGPLASAFNAEGLARNLVFLFCGPLSLLWIFNGVIFIGNAAYNNLGHPFYSTWVNWGRNTVGVFPFVYYGSIYWGAEGVLIGQMAGGVVVGIVSFLLAEYVMRKAERDEVEGAQTERPAHLRRDFSIMNHRK